MCTQSSSPWYALQVFDLYGVGLRQALSTPNLLKTLNLKAGKLSTGDSLDTSPQDEASIISNHATVKDMEGAAVAYVADLLKVPAIFVKAITDIVDGDKPTAEEFLQNLAAVTAALDQAVTEVVDFINGKVPLRPLMYFIMPFTEDMIELFAAHLSIQLSYD
ncbi:methylthioadenosine nucleosidase 1 [Actinidia rufa]|uniref:Methylthioadenosine nucleosidase 1 n=1 Tax=Actinidia rufa TaxID=165716 RepID=A0A7J0FPG9_9ERIC|nr:methylthioadenosine nucleosidase 1 [Actinidia rufa]